jgi:hypothetical protein
MAGLGLLTAFLVLFTAAPAHAQLYAAVLPSARSVQVGQPAMAFATILNAGSSTAVGCSIAPATSVPATFSYQTTDPTTNVATGTPNAPVDIAPGGAQTFVFAFTPTVAFAAINVQLAFACVNGLSAPSVTGMNTFAVTATTGPVADMVEFAVTPTNDGVVRVNVGASAAFAVAISNFGGSSNPAGFNPFYSGVIVDTAAVSLPIQVTMCETNPATGACLAPPVAAPGPCGFSPLSVCPVFPVSPLPGESRTLGIFVTAGGAVAFDPAVNRIFVRHGYGSCGGFVCGFSPATFTSVAVTAQ